MLLVPVRPSLSLPAFFDLWKALIQVKAHTRKDGTQVKAHTRNVQSRAERRELVEALARQMARGADTRHATLASAVGAARHASKANGKAVHVYEHADGGWVATHDARATEGHAEKIVAVKGKARLHREGEASRSLRHLKGPIAEHVPHANTKRHTYALGDHSLTLDLVPQDHIGIEPMSAEFPFGRVHYPRELTPEEVKAGRLDYITSKGRLRSREDDKASRILLHGAGVETAGEYLIEHLDMALEDHGAKAKDVMLEPLEHLKERRPDLAPAIKAWVKKQGWELPARAAKKPAPAKEAPVATPKVEEPAPATGWPAGAAVENGKAGKQASSLNVSAGDVLSVHGPSGSSRVLVVAAQPDVKPSGQFVLEAEHGTQTKVQGGFFGSVRMQMTHTGQAYPGATGHGVTQDPEVRAIVEGSGGTLLSGPSPKVRAPKFDSLAADTSGRFHVYGGRLGMVGRERPNLLSKKSESYRLTEDIPYIKADPKAMRMVSEVAFFPPTASDKAHRIQGVTALSNGAMVNTGMLQALRSEFPEATLHVLPPGEPLAGNAYHPMVYALDKHGQLVGFMPSLVAEEPHLRKLSAAIKWAGESPAGAGAGEQPAAATAGQTEAPRAVEVGAKYTDRKVDHIPVKTDGKLTHVLKKDGAGLWQVHAVAEESRGRAVKTTEVRNNMPLAEATRYVKAAASGDKATLTEFHKADGGVPLAEMPKHKPMDRERLYSMPGEDGQTWHTDGMMVTSAPVEKLKLAPNGTNMPAPDHWAVAKLRPVSTKPVQPVAYKTDAQSHGAGAVVFDNGAMLSHDLYHDLTRLHPGATWHQGTSPAMADGSLHRLEDKSKPDLSPDRYQVVDDPRLHHFVLKDAQGKPVALVPAMRAGLGDSQAFADKVAAGHRPGPSSATKVARPPLSPEQAAARAAKAAQEAASLEKTDAGVALADMPKLGPYKLNEVVRDRGGSDWHSDGFMASRAPLREKDVARNAKESTQGISSIVPTRTNPVEPAGYVTHEGAHFVVFDNGTAINARIYQHLMKQHPGATWRQGAGRGGEEKKDAPFVLENAKGEAVGMALPLMIRGEKVQDFAHRIAAGHRPQPTTR